MVNKLFKHSTNIITLSRWIPIIVSLLALIFSVGSFFISNESVKVSQDIERDNLSYQIDQTSLNYMLNAYDELFYKPENLYVLHLIKENYYVNDIDKFKKVIDVFEGVGSNFCQGSVKKKHIQPYLYNTLKYMCDDTQLNNMFPSQKNGIAMLCKEFYPDSQFAKKIDLSHIDQCTFFDSSVFNNDPGLKRYIFPSSSF